MKTSSLLLLLILMVPGTVRAQQKTKPPGADPVPEPAIPAILGAFDKYEVVAMMEAHGFKDADDFILSLVRNPVFPEKVNDIEVECGNSLYQPILDRYIAGEDVPFTEVRKVWRNTALVMCSTSGFFEQFFPLVRAINQKLPLGKRLQVLAGDPPFDWEQIKTKQDPSKIFDRDPSIAAVMEKEVLSKHRKALLLFGTGHLLHSLGDVKSPPAVSIYERDYPNVTFVIAVSTDGLFAGWPVPSLARSKGTWLGALETSQVIPGVLAVDKDCNLAPQDWQKPAADLVDAFLYLGPHDVMLREQMSADIALDTDYMKEVQDRAALAGTNDDMTSEQFIKRVVNGAENPFSLFIPILRRWCRVAWSEGSKVAQVSSD